MGSEKYPKMGRTPLKPKELDKRHPTDDPLVATMRKACRSQSPHKVAAEVARLLGIAGAQVTEWTVYNWILGHRKPNPIIRPLLEKVLRKVR
jgi:hypothetical protein